jgi:threonine/homoserine/homoserine lactone efflux protein
LGFGVIFDALPWLHEVIKVAGIAYLLYLAWLIANAAPSSLDGQKSSPFSFVQAVLFQWVNPKAWIMATGAVATYTSATGNIYLEVLTITLVFFLVAFPCIGSWLLFGVWLKNILKNTLYQRLFNGLMALLLVISILPVSVELLQRYWLS